MNNDSVNFSLLKITRSGRAVKPRMATWTGQRIMYNVHGSPIKAIGITTDSIYSTSASDAVKIFIDLNYFRVKLKGKLLIGNTFGPRSLIKKCGMNYPCIPVLDLIFGTYKFC